MILAWQADKRLEHRRYAFKGTKLLSLSITEERSTHK